MLEFGGEQNFPTSVAFLIICFFVTPVCAILIRDNPPHHTAVDAGTLADGHILEWSTCDTFDCSFDISRLTTVKLFVVAEFHGIGRSHHRMVSFYSSCKEQLKPEVEVSKLYSFLLPRLVTPTHTSEQSRTSEDNSVKFHHERSMDIWIFIF